MTGAASGIGRGVVERLLAEGVERVVAVDVDERRLEEVAALGAHPLAADLGTVEGCDRVAHEGAGATYLVNAAGAIRLTPIFDVTREEWRAVFAVNAEAVFFLCQRIGATMPEGGAIVNVSSVAAKLQSTPEAAPYAATKTAVISITRSFAHVLAARGVRVNAILPGIIDTPMQDTVLDEVAAARGITRAELSEQRESTVPLGRAATTAECAAAIWFLLSGASYATGEAMNFSGGMVMR